MNSSICNSGPLIALGKLHHLHILERLHPQLIIPHAVYQEVVVFGLQRGAPEASTVRHFCTSSGWRVLETPPDNEAGWQPAVTLDPGEMEVLLHARRHSTPTVLIDDELARGEARRLGLTVYGTLGIITRAFRGGLVPLTVALLLLREIGERPDIWISRSLCERVAAELVRSHGGDVP